MQARIEEVRTEIEVMIERQSRQEIEKPFEIFIIFQSLEGRDRALKQYGKLQIDWAMDEHKLERDPYHDVLKLRTSQSPHSFEWENKDVSRQYQVVALVIFLLIMGLYILIIYYAMTYSRYYFESVYFDYPWLA